MYGLPIDSYHHVMDAKENVTSTACRFKKFLHIFCGI